MRHILPILLCLACYVYAASSEPIRPQPNPAADEWKREVCMRKANGADALYRALMIQQLTKEEVLAAPREPGVTKDQVEEVRAMADEILVFQGSWPQYVALVWNRCMSSEVK